MVYSLQGIQKLLRDMEERQQKQKRRLHNKKVGYAPKCTVCTNPELDEIERLREENYTYQEIKDILELDCSIMALSRHFQNHYPISQAYKEKQKIQMLENIQEAYLKYPFLEEYFKDKDLEYLELFNTGAGFCTDKFKLCDLIPESTVSNSTENIKTLREMETREIASKRERYFRLDKGDENSIKLRYDKDIIDCLSCKNQSQEERLTLLEKIITYNFLNIAPEDKEIYFNLLQFNGSQEEFIQLLEEGKEVNQQAK